MADAEGPYLTWMNDPEVTKYLETGFYPQSEAELRDYIESRRDTDDLFLAIIHKEDDRHIGNVKLGEIDHIHRRGNLGIIIGEKDYWGRGIATETIDLLTQYAFETLNIHKVTAGALKPNEGSIRAFKKVGFEIEGERVEHVYCNGEYVNEVLMGLVKSEYSSLETCRNNIIDIDGNRES